MKRLKQAIIVLARFERIVVIALIPLTFLIAIIVGLIEFPFHFLLIPFSLLVLVMGFGPAQIIHHICLKLHDSEEDAKAWSALSALLWLPLGILAAECWEGAQMPWDNWIYASGFLISPVLVLYLREMAKQRSLVKASGKRDIRSVLWLNYLMIGLCCLVLAILRFGFVLSHGVEK